MSLLNIGEWIVSVILIKGLVVHYVVGWIDKGLHKWFQTTDRKQSIYLHYRERALGNGHEDNDVTRCHQGQCQILA